MIVGYTSDSPTDFYFCSIFRFTLKKHLEEVRSMPIMQVLAMLANEQNCDCSAIGLEIGSAADGLTKLLKAVRDEYNFYRIDCHELFLTFVD